MSGLLTTFFDSKYVKCRAEILYSDMFGARFRTEFYFEYFGTPKDGGFEMQPVRGGLQMFKPVPAGTKARASTKPPPDTKVTELTDEAVGDEGEIAEGEKE